MYNIQERFHGFTPVKVTTASVLTQCILRKLSDMKHGWIFCFVLLCFVHHTLQSTTMQTCNGINCANSLTSRNRTMKVMAATKVFSWLAP